MRSVLICCAFASLVAVAVAKPQVCGPGACSDISPYHTHSSSGSDSGSSGNSVDVGYERGHEESREENQAGLEAFRAGEYQAAIDHFKEALRLEPIRLWNVTWDGHWRTILHKNIKEAEDHLKEQEKDRELQRVAIARKQYDDEQRARSKKYGSLPSPPPPPRSTGEPALIDRVRMTLSNDLERIATYVRSGGELPSWAKKEISDEVFHYVSEYGVPDGFARTYWTTNKPTSDDMNVVFDAIRKDLRDSGGLGTGTQKALDRFDGNLRSRVFQVAQDTKKQPPR